MTPTIRFVLITALRDRLFAALFAALALVIAVSLYLGSAAVTEAAETSIVYAASGARTILVLGLVMFTAFHIERLYETREIEAILSRAISRESFIVSYWGGLAVLALLLAAPVVAAAMGLHVSLAGAALWSVTLVFEVMIVLAFAVFCGITIARAIPTVFACMGFYALSRLGSFFVSIASEATGFAPHGGMNKVADPLIVALSYVFPRLDLFAQTRWLVYGPDETSIFYIVSMQFAIYVSLLLFAAMFDLRRKGF